MSSVEKRMRSGACVGARGAAPGRRSASRPLRYWRHLGTEPRSSRVGRNVNYRDNDVIQWLSQQRDNDGPKAT